MPFAPQELWHLLPELVLAGMGLILLLFGTLRGEAGHRQSAVVTVLALAVSAAYLIWGQKDLGAPQEILAGMLVLDRFSFYWKLLVLAATVLVVMLSVDFLEEGGYRAPEYYALLLFATTGMMFMASGNTLLSIWVALELMALSSYVLAGYFKRHTRSVEAALKYFILGAVSSGILLYGVSLLYGATGSITLSGVAAGIGASPSSPLVVLGWILLAVGLLFKVSAAPFHVWTPDVYVGAPTPVTAYLAAASKAASFAILVRILVQAVPAAATRWQLVVAAIACLSMVWGNVAALTQQNVKRMLAYSSVAHAGYAMLGLLAVDATIGIQSVLFYLLAYSFITIGAFGTVVLLERKEYAGEVCADYAGLASRSPFLAAMMLLFLLGLTGIPPTGGFVGKLYLFGAAIKAGWVWPAVIGVLTSAVSLYYYFRIVVFMYQKPEEEGTVAPSASRLVLATVTVCALVILAMGLVPQPFFEWASIAALPVP